LSVQVRRFTTAAAGAILGHRYFVVVLLLGTGALDWW
jgi:hypothetical protein